MPWGYGGSQDQPTHVSMTHAHARDDLSRGNVQMHRYVPLVSLYVPSVRGDVSKAVGTLFWVLTKLERRLSV